MTIFPGVEIIFKKNKDKKDKLFSIFKEYIDISKQLQSLKDTEKLILIKQLENQIDEYFICLKDITDLVELNNCSDSLLNKAKHISEIDSSNFKFIEVYVVTTDKGILLSVDKIDNADKVRLATFRKVNN